MKSSIITHAVLAMAALILFSACNSTPPAVPPTKDEIAGAIRVMVNEMASKRDSPAIVTVVSADRCQELDGEIWKCYIDFQVIVRSQGDFVRKQMDGFFHKNENGLWDAVTDPSVKQ